MAGPNVSELPFYILTLIMCGVRGHLAQLLLIF